MKTEFIVIATLLLTACGDPQPYESEQVVCSSGFRERGDISYFSNSNHVRIAKHDGSAVYYTPVPGETCMISEIQQ